MDIIHRGRMFQLGLDGNPVTKSHSGGAARSFENLPPEIHLLISRHLTYPDALSLKHVSRYFYCLVDTGLKLKVDWLIERRSLHLECPNDRRCDLGSDLKFCRGSVRLLMQRRREHAECESRPGLGCLVYGTAKCAHRRQLKWRIKRWLRSRLTIELWWCLVPLVPVLLGCLWVAEFARWHAEE
ncbi:f-box domain protein [Daldinia childiae]|uniref:f-box domain protein n=1 Tax=Daldinia childiae TaxID=326645 RepID=UPI0014483054|nr:f-box domain protein [Daldinia childiae]KAF3062231.1 f-box domain protein [Daldinia childiae]